MLTPSQVSLPEVPASVPEPVDVVMLEHAYVGVLSRSMVAQVTHRDLLLSLWLSRLLP